MKIKNRKITREFATYKTDYSIYVFREFIVHRADAVVRNVQLNFRIRIKYWTVLSNNLVSQVNCLQKWKDAYSMKRVKSTLFIDQCQSIDYTHGWKQIIRWDKERERNRERKRTERCRVVYIVSLVTIVWLYLFFFSLIPIFSRDEKTLFWEQPKESTCISNN